MAQFILVILIKGRCKDMEFRFPQTKKDMKDNFKKINFVEKELTFI